MIIINFSYILVYFAICGFSLCQGNNDEKETLELVVTLFRHGDRTTDLSATYPKDPHLNDTYYPYGYGELTNAGKNKMYKLGQTFRKLYDSFLGPLYVPGLIDSLSTDMSRTKSSLQLFLAGLFPPARTILEWNKELNWNPIPFNYVAFETNRVLSFPILHCPKYKQLYAAYKESPKGLDIEKRYKAMYSDISQNTGLNITSISQLFVLYFGLVTEYEWGLKLPEWTKPLFPDYFKNITEDAYKSFIATPQLNQLFGGFLLKKTINDINRKISETNKLKMYIYSGHEISIVSLLGALNIYFPHIPNYAACVILELHRIKEKHYIKVLYNTDNTYEFADVEIPGCNTICPLEKFVALLQENIPEDGDPCITNENKN